MRTIFKLALAVLLVPGLVLAQDDISLSTGIIGNGKKLGAKTYDGQTTVGVLGVDSSGNTALTSLSGKSVTIPGTSSFTGNLTLGANLVFSAASAKIIPGATSLLFRNTADSATTLSILNNGTLTLGGALTTASTILQVLGGSTNTRFDNNASSATNLTIADAGDITVGRGDVIISTTGKTLHIQEATAASACMGVATPNGTTNVTVTTSCAVSGSRIFYARVGAVTNMASISTTTAPNGTSFTFASTSGTDTLAGSVVYFIIREAA